MTQEEFYIWLLNCSLNPNKIPHFNSEFLKNYEIAKLFLEKFEIDYLRENQQKNLNPEAVSAWFNNSKYIYLQYDIPEILELLPERIGGCLDLSDSEIRSLPKLKSIGDDLDLIGSQIQSLPQLESVGGWLELRYSEIQSLPKLKYIRNNLNLRNSKIQSLPELKYVGTSIIVDNDQVEHWKKYFNETGRQNLAGKVRP